MKIKNYSARSLARRFYNLIEDCCTVAPQDSGRAVWLEQSPSDNIFEAKHSERIICSKAGRIWKGQKPIENSGVCVVEDAAVWMLRPKDSLFRDQMLRQAIIFNRHGQRISCPGGRRLLPYIFRGQWRSWFLDKNKRNNFEGRVAILGNFVMDSYNYYHFWADTIADIWFMNQILPEDQRPERYLIPFVDLPWQRQILELCRIDMDKVIPFYQHDHIAVESLIVPIRDKGAGTLPPWLSKAIRSSVGWKETREAGNRLIYLSRTNAPRRRLSNEHILLEPLLKEGFVVHTLDGLSVREQQHLFSEAAVIVAPHGAALTNVVWCQPGTVVVELLSEDYLVPCFRDLSWQTGLVYHPIVCQPVSRQEQGITGDIVITPEQIKSVLEFVVRRAQCI